MKLCLFWTVLLTSKIADAFVSPTGLNSRQNSFSFLKAKRTVNQKRDLHINLEDSEPKNDWKRIVSSCVAAGTIIASIASSPLAAYANVELSSGALNIQTTKQNGQSLTKAEIDTKSLLSSLFRNRKELTASFNRISNIVQEELKQPAWVELEREILEIEDDVTPEIKLKPPADWQQTVKDISQGKINFIYNGEIINLSIDDSFSAAEDEIIIRAKGVKGVPISGIQESPKTVVKSNLQKQIDAVELFWNSPLPFGQDIVQKVETSLGTKITTGNFLLVSIVALVGGSYVAAYSYYVSQIEDAQREAEEKRRVIEEKKQKAAKKAASKNEQ